MHQDHPARLTVLQYLNNLRPALPMSMEKPGTGMTNGELRRCIAQRGVLINQEAVAVDELIDFPVFSLVFFPKSPTRKTTLV